MAYTRQTSSQSSLPVPGADPAIFPVGDISKVSGGGTYTVYCPWDRAKFVYADATTTTVVATEDLTITITFGGSTIGTITVATSGSALGTFDEVASLVTTNMSKGDTITITTTDSANAGAAFVRLWFEPAV